MQVFITDLEIALKACRETLEKASEYSKPDAYRVGVYQQTIESIEHYLDCFKKRESVPDKLTHDPKM